MNIDINRYIQVNLTSQTYNYVVALNTYLKNEIIIFLFGSIRFQALSYYVRNSYIFLYCTCVFEIKERC